MRTQKEVEARLEEVGRKKSNCTSMSMLLSLQTEYDTLLWILGRIN